MLEFGSGLSSLLMAELAKVTSYEIDEEWAVKIRSKSTKNLEVKLWDGRNIESGVRYDLVFIDGPRGGENREPAFQAAVKASNRIIVHDSRRGHETSWQEKYLKCKYQLVSHNGFHINSCRYWEGKK